MQHNEFHFNFHQTKFFGQYWASNKIKGVVVLVHGMGEHSGRYVHVAKKMVAHEFALVAYDHFGHGKTEGKKGHNPGYDMVLESISKLVEEAISIFGDLPIFLYGHSMGGNAVVNYLLRKKKYPVKGAVVTSPFLGLAFTPPKWKLTMGRLLQKIAPSITMGNELDTALISRDKKEVEKYCQDPMVHDKVSPNYSISFIDAGKWAIENASLLSCPMLLLHGTADQITDPICSESFAKNTDLVTLKLYRGGYHELHNDLCKEEVLQDITDWLETQVEN